MGTVPGIGHNSISLTNLPQDSQKRVKQSIVEIEGSLTRIAAERDLQKEILDKLEQDLGVNKKLVRRIARAYFKGNFNIETVENDEFETAYKQILE